MDAGLARGRPNAASTCEAVVSRGVLRRQESTPNDKLGFRTVSTGERLKGTKGDGKEHEDLGVGRGWVPWLPTALHLSEAGHEVAVADSFIRRHYDNELGVESLVPVEQLCTRRRSSASR